MATRRDGNVRRATDNSVTAARRSAKARQCPACERKSALTYVPDIGQRVCRWCGHGVSSRPT